MTLNRSSISELIFNKLKANASFLKSQFTDAKNSISYFYIDDLLPTEIADVIYNTFPTEQRTIRKKSLKEHKHIAVQMNEYEPLLEEVIYAFQQPKIVKLIEGICNFKKLVPDEHLYAGGLSMMKKDHFLNPHLDNSHDKDRNKWRALNLLFYVTPDWEVTYGGNLELWPNGPKKGPITIHSKFNRLVVMATHNKSWHSVSKVTHHGVRCCVSNYYFSEIPVLENSKFHVTTFRGRPEQKVRDLYLKMDAFARMNIRKIFKKGIIENPHKYLKDE